MKKILIGLVILLVLCGCNSNTEYEEPSREEVTATNPALGKKETDIKPVLIVEKKEDSLYVGEKDYDFGSVEGYSDNGEVEITFNDENVDYEKAGDYTVLAVVDDGNNEEQEELTLALEEKPKPVQKSVINGQNNEGTSQSTGGAQNTGTVWQIGIDKYYSYDDYVNAFCSLPNIDYTHPTMYGRYCK